MRILERLQGCHGGSCPTGSGDRGLARLYSMLGILGQMRITGCWIWEDAKSIQPNSSVVQARRLSREGKTLSQATQPGGGRAGARTDALAVGRMEPGCLGQGHWVERVSLGPWELPV